MNIYGIISELIHNYMIGGLMKAWKIIASLWRMIWWGCACTVRTRLQTRYKDIADRLVTFALESVDYDEDRASTILEMMKREEQQQQLQQQQLKLSQHTPRIRLASAASAVVALNRERYLANSFETRIPIAWPPSFYLLLKSIVRPCLN